MVIQPFAFRRAIPWFSAGTVFGVIGSQFLQDYFLTPQAVSPPPTPITPSVETSPHYPSGFPLPSTSNVHIRPAFTTSMNYRTRTPDWVAEMLTAEIVNGKNGERKNAQFKSDTDIPEHFRANNDDYWDSGWSRGHLAASASHKLSQEGQDSTFLLNSNIVPQDLSMNGCDWNRLEVLVRDVVKAHPQGQVFVLSGPMWVAESKTPFTQRPFSKNKVVMHEVLGDTQVHVPTHMFKVIYVRDESQRVSASAAFVMPNRPILEEQRIESYKTTIEDLERQTGLTLDGLRGRVDLCTVVKCEKPTNHRMLGWRHYGFIDEARDLDDLRQAVQNAIDAGFVDGDNFLIPKAVKDRMNDLGIGEDVTKLFPNDEKYQAAVTSGFNMFKRRSSQSPQ